MSAVTTKDRLPSHKTLKSIKEYKSIQNPDTFSSKHHLNNLVNGRPLYINKLHNRTTVPRLQPLSSPSIWFHWWNKCSWMCHTVTCALYDRLAQCQITGCTFVQPSTTIPKVQNPSYFALLPACRSINGKYSCGIVLGSGGITCCHIWIIFCLKIDRPTSNSLASNI